MTVDFIVAGQARHAEVMSVTGDTEIVVQTPATGLDSTIERIAERITSALRRADADGFATLVSVLGSEIGELLREDPLASVPPHVFLLGRVLGLLSGVAAQLGVRINPVRALLPRLFEGR